MMLRRILQIIALLVVVVVAVTLGAVYGGKLAAFFGHRQTASTSAPSPGERKVQYWYDAMDPQRHYDKPGKAPDGMDLVPQYADDETGGSKGTGTTKIDPAKQQLIGVRTETVERQDLTRTVRTTGQLTADETKLAHIHLKVAGWIE